MGLGRIFKAIGKGALDVLRSPVGDILIAKYVPRKFKPLLDIIGDIVSDLDREEIAPDRTGREKTEIAYRQAAIEAQRLGIEYHPSELYALIEDKLQEQKGNAVFKE